MTVRETMLIGAYERENFGDLLFAHVTRALLGSNTSSTLSTPFAPHASSLDELDISRIQLPIPDSVKTFWVVGGEVGGTTLSRAFPMSASDEDYATWTDAGRADRRALLEARSPLDPHDSAYMPLLKGYLGKYVLNSAGLYSVGGLRGSELYRALRVLYRADFVSVRERWSHRLLRALGVRHEVAPDIVHTLAATSLIAPSGRRPIALVQIRQETLEQLGAREVARFLINAKGLSDLDICFFQAGSARNHDSASLYEQVIDEARSLDPGRALYVQSPSTSLEKATLIAEASVWVGTSLHGNIVSTAFGVPHVGLSNVKVDRYCATWGDPMPSGIALPDLDEAVQHARSARTVESGIRYSEAQRDLAMTNFRLAQSVAS